METEKKPKSGFARLKVKYEKLEAENKELKEALSKAQVAHVEYSRKTAEELKKVETNRNYWKEAYDKKQKEHAELDKEYNKVLGWLDVKEHKIAFLLDHCPFWVRWMYKRAF